MGWSIGYDANWKRDIGYGVPATCDHPKCGAEIDRGLAHVCGSQPMGGEVGCGLYFCAKHLPGYRRAAQLCSRCTNYRPAYKATPDVDEWVQHKLTDESWAKWRARNPDFVKLHAPTPGSPKG
jgi:hypothetical protein